MISFSAAQIRRFAPLARPDIVDELVRSVDEINAAGIDTPQRLWAFMANISPETGGLRSLEENLNYSASRLCKVFPSRVTSDSLAKQLAHKPEKIANFLYGGRFGNNKSGDGWKYRGRGMLQNTFKANYADAGYADCPELLAQPEHALKAALSYWVSKNCNRFADKGDLTGLRKVINGGTNGVQEMKAAYAKARACLPGVADGAVAIEQDRDTIRTLQRQLVAAGYHPGVIDGLVGEQTIGEISKFQAANGLAITGRFDASTREALKNPPDRVVYRTEEKPKNSRIDKAADAIFKGGLGTGAVTGGAEILKQTGLDKVVTQVEGAKSTIEAVKIQVDTLQQIAAPFIAVKDFLVANVGMTGFVVIAACVVAYGAWKIREWRRQDHLSGKTA